MRLLTSLLTLSLSSARPPHAQLIFVLRNNESSERQISKLSKLSAYQSLRSAFAFLAAWRTKESVHETSCQLGVYTQPTYVQDDARRVSREHRDVVTSKESGAQGRALVIG